MFYNKLMKKICKSCGSEHVIEIKKGVRDDVSINVLKCKKCGLEFLSDFSHINQNFYQKGDMHDGMPTELWVKRFYEDDKRRINLLKKYIKNKNILDFGTGSGGFLEVAKNIAKKVVGCEIDESLTDYYKEKNLTVKTSIEEYSENFDVISLFHVLEHLENSEKILVYLKQFLKKNGMLIIEVPNSDDALLTLYNSAEFKNFTYWVCHLYSFNEKSLMYIFKKCGLKVKKTYYVQRYPYTNHIGWLKDKSGGGHLRYKANKFLNFLYIKFLQIIKKTDTILFIVENI